MKRLAHQVVINFISSESCYWRVLVFGIIKRRISMNALPFLNIHDLISIGTEYAGKRSGFHEFYVNWQNYSHDEVQLIDNIFHELLAVVQCRSKVAYSFLLRIFPKQRDWPHTSSNKMDSRQGPKRSVKHPPKRFNQNLIINVVDKYNYEYKMLGYSPRYLISEHTAERVIMNNYYQFCAHFGCADRVFRLVARRIDPVDIAVFSSVLWT